MAARAQRLRLRMRLGADVAHVGGQARAQQAAHDAHAHRAGADDADRGSVRFGGRGHVLLGRGGQRRVRLAVAQRRRTLSMMNCSSVPLPRSSMLPLL